MGQTKANDHDGDEIEVIDLLSPSPVKLEDEGTPLRPVFCLKNKADVKVVEKIYDCFILDFDPSDSFTTLSLSSELDNAKNDEVVLISEKGQVACRDYPHSRHLCMKFPFDKTEHESYCDLCYCYVCDEAAPCKYWTAGSDLKDNTLRPHCDASEKVEEWKSERQSTRRNRKDEK